MIGQGYDPFAAALQYGQVANAAPVGGPLGGALLPQGQDGGVVALARQLAMQAPPPAGGIQDLMRMFGGSLQTQDPMKAPYHAAHPISLGSGSGAPNTITPLFAQANQTRGNMPLGDLLTQGRR